MTIIIMEQETKQVLPIFFLKLCLFLSDLGWYEIIYQVYTHPRILERLGCGGIRVITTCGTDLLVPVTE